MLIQPQKEHRNAVILPEIPLHITEMTNEWLYIAKITVF